jgi:spore maturation protein CgeB
LSAIESEAVPVAAPGAIPPRVLVIGHHLHADGFEWHILDALRHLGAEARFVETQPLSSRTPKLAQRAADRIARLLLREPERLFEERLVRATQAFAPSLILVTLGNQVSPKTIARLRKVSDAAIVCWCQDQMTTMGRQFLLGSEYDAVFVKDRYMQDLFSRMIRSSTFYYLPEACNPRVHRPVALGADERGTYDCDVMIAGTLYYYRQEILRQLTDFKVKVWGSRPDWLLYRLAFDHPAREIVCDEKARAVAGARICLNTLHYAEVDGLNCRAFEIAGCGGFQLITQVPVLAEHFEVGQEIVAFRSTSDLTELIRHYLDHPESAAQIARAGQVRVHREHTYERRLQEIFRIALGPRAGAARLTLVVPAF